MCFIDAICKSNMNKLACKNDALTSVLSCEGNDDDDSEVLELISYMESFGPNRRIYFEDLGTAPSKVLPSIVQASKLELKLLPGHLK